MPRHQQTDTNFHLLSAPDAAARRVRAFMPIIGARITFDPGA
jgi:hypothetical protein